MGVKTIKEIEELTERLYPLSPNPMQKIEGFERVAFKKGYLQALEDINQDTNTTKKHTDADTQPKNNDL